jgi:hypothetical protein
MDVGASSLEVERYLNLKKCFLLSIFLCLIVGCQSSFLKLDKEDDLKLKSNQNVVIEAEKVQTAQDKKVETAPPPLLAEQPKTKAKKKVVKKSKTQSKKPEEAVIDSIEDTEGFIGRRPIKDPFHVGEKITHEAYYNLFGFTAGVLTLDTLPFVQVNGRKAYQFALGLKTSKLFNTVYSIEDQVETLVDYELWLPRLYNMHVKESSQLREGRSYFDFQNLKAHYDEKKVSKKKGAEEKTQEWDILPYSQNVFSIIFYMRLFAWRDGKDYSFRIANDNENLVFKGRVVAREKLDTDIGPMNAIKIKPEIILKGSFKPVGDIFIWLSDDDRKIPLRIESKIKIGTIVSEITDYQPGIVP